MGDTVESLAEAEVNGVHFSPLTHYSSHLSLYTADGNQGGRACFIPGVTVPSHLPLLHGAQKPGHFALLILNSCL